MTKPGVLAIILATAAVPLAAATASAETRQFANLVYDLPAGWEAGGTSDGRQELRYAAEDEACDNCRILLDPGVAGGGPIADWRDAQAVLPEDMTLIGEPKVERGTAGDWTLHVLMRMVDDDGRQRFQAFFAIDLPERNELVIFEGSARDEAALERSLAALNADLVPMLEAARFVSEGAEPVLGPPQPGDLDGPWFGTAISNRYDGLSGTLQLVVDRELMTFYADGRFYRGIPPSGSGPLDVEGLVAAGETGLGNYLRSGDEIELRYVDGDVARLGMSGASGLRWGGVTMYPAAFAPDGFRFSGVIHATGYTAFGAGVSGGVAHERTQVFRDDGTFTDSSFTGVSGTFDSGGGFTGITEQPEALGHYTVADGLITLSSPDGQERTTWIILEGGSNVIIGGQPVSAADE